MKANTIPIPKPIVGLVNAVAIAVPQPTAKFAPRKCIRSFGWITPLITELTSMALNAAFGVGDIMLMYCRQYIHTNAVVTHDNCEVVPAIRETSDRDIDALTGAEPVSPATMHAAP
uniref:Uncharacterized protein n=1 Tax=Odontella aurita TaxID=265563 RepID=A0A7S4JT15_9STRA